ncbi:MAG: PilZ domain-containing protein [Kofleriaceae bacterium]|nr:PilZ domain-containing protein [Kofleriaceae bacterium]
MSSNPREHPRYAHVAQVIVYSGQQSYRGRTTNVSRGGLCVAVDSAVALGLDVDVDVSLVFSDNAESEPLRLRARTAWCTAVDQTFQLGLSFRAMPVDATRYLQMFLKYLEVDRAALPVRVDAADDIFTTAVARSKAR